MTAVMRYADARLSASIIRSISMRESLTPRVPSCDLQIDWMTNASAPRTFSWISIRHSSLANVVTSALPTSLLPSFWAISTASARLELPEKRTGFAVAITSVSSVARRDAEHLRWSVSDGAVDLEWSTVDVQAQALVSPPRSIGSCYRDGLFGPS